MIDQIPPFLCPHLERLRLRRLSLEQERLPWPLREARASFLGHFCGGLEAQRWSEHGCRGTIVSGKKGRLTRVWSVTSYASRSGIGTATGGVFSQSEQRSVSPSPLWTTEDGEPISPTATMVRDVGRRHTWLDGGGDGGLRLAHALHHSL